MPATRDRVTMKIIDAHHHYWDITIGLAVLADPIIEVLLTDKWLPAVPLLQLLCLVGILHPLHAINLNIINVKGRSDIFPICHLSLLIFSELFIIMFTFGAAFVGFCLRCFFPYIVAIRTH